MSANSVETLLTEAAGLEDAIEVIASINSRPGEAWMMNLDEQMVFVEYQAPARMICLRAPLELPPEGDREPLYAQLLRYNWLWCETGGMAISLDQDGTDIHLMMPLVLEGLQVVEFVRLLNVFVARAQQWQDTLSRYQAGQGDPADATPATASDAWIRA